MLMNSRGSYQSMACIATALVALVGCTLPASAATTQPAQAQPGTPKEDWRSRPTNPAYLAAMPYVETVKSTIKGTSPDDTLARQLAVFTYLPEMMKHMREASRPYRSPWTADETTITYAYNLAAKQILDDYSKTHTPQQTAQLQQQEGHYELMDDQFQRDWFNALFPADFREAYHKAAWGLLARYKAHVDQEQKQTEEAMARPKSTAGGSGGPYQDAGSVAVRRCLELGGSQLECLGKGMTTGMFDLVGFNPAALSTSSSYAGLTVTGSFQSPGGLSAGFGGTNVGFSGCGNLVIDNRAYSIERKGSQILIQVRNSPTPFTLVLEPDGRLVGPASADIAGKVVTGYRRYWVQTASHYTQYGNFVPGTGHEEREPIFTPKTQSCAIGTFMPGPPTAPDAGLLSNTADFLGKLSGQSTGSANNTEKDLLAPGVRMTGVYASPGGLKADFTTASVVLDCGEAHARGKYAVERAGSQLLLHIQNPSGPFTATVQPDGSLSGPGSVAVAGRIATGMNGNQVNFVARNATCSAERLTPNGAGARASSSPSPSDAAGESPASSSSSTSPAGNAALSVVSGFPAGANPLAGKFVLLDTQRFDDEVRGIGLHPPADISPGQAWLEMAKALATPHYCDPPRNCQALISAIGQFAVAKFKMPDGGSGAFPSKVPAGTYYVRSAAPQNNGVMFWDVKVELKPGANSVTLDTRNAETVK